MRGPCVHLGTKALCLYPINPYNSTITLVTIARLIHVFNNLLLFYNENWSIFMNIEKFITIIIIIIGHSTLFQENGSLLLWKDPAVKKRPPIFSVCALIMHEITHSRNAQCTAGE